ncbi:esterase/lipase family protein [Streptomyces sp. UG1]|uniref:esterase/lipase family protein n=1 Tax=Streptomyces sp. UG1 TaxID=3417652 RepID=UPI003CFB1640
MEAGRAAVRLARLPLDIAVEGVGQLTGWLGRALPTGSMGSEEVTPAGSGMPVLLVHGLDDREWVVSSLQRGLDGCGVGLFIPAGYNALTPDIRAAARRLGDQVERACARVEGRPVVLIGYSLGGLIARYYVQRLGGDLHVPLVITLATPHGGTTTALLAPPHPLLRQLRPGSELLSELAEPAAGCRTRFVAFYSDLDAAVIPAARARVEHPDLTARNVLVPGVGHLTLPLHQPVIDQVRALLTAAGQGTWVARAPSGGAPPRPGPPRRRRHRRDSTGETEEAGK